MSEIVQVVVVRENYSYHISKISKLKIFFLVFDHNHFLDLAVSLDSDKCCMSKFALVAWFTVSQRHYSDGSTIVLEKIHYTIVCIYSRIASTMSGHYMQTICIAARIHYEIGVSYAGSLYHRDFWIRGCYEPPRIKNLTLLYMLLFYKHNNLNVCSVDRHHYQFHFSVKMERAT